MNSNNSNHQDSFNLLQMLSDTSDLNDGMENLTFPDFNDVSNQSYNSFTSIMQTRTPSTPNHGNGLTKNILHSNRYNSLSTPLSQSGISSLPLSPTNSVTEEQKNREEKTISRLFSEKSCATNVWMYSNNIFVVKYQDILKKTRS